MDWDLFDLKGTRKVAVVGIGGGGDVLGTIPTRNSLKRSKFDVLIGSVVWERFVVDPKPGPRSLDELDNVEDILSETVCLAGSRTRIRGGAVPQACRLSAKLGEKVLLLDITKGAKGLASGIRKMVDKLGMSFVVGIDVGGDVLATGKEEGLRSPLCDSLTLAAMVNSGVNSIVGVVGLGCDGELKPQELESRLSEIASMGGLLGALGMTKDDIKLMEFLSEGLNTEASKLTIMAAKGVRGDVLIRDGTRTAYVSVFSSITFLLDAQIVYKTSELAKAVANSESIDEANEAMHSLGVETELDFERDVERLGIKSYRDYVLRMGK
ncbi:MAG: DUF1152 domain-containing protein [Nitrososphaerota archaeon]|nr:DUF1152 domain-containing protein [Aigarchaeota archaeon]MDW8076698.1 DUF1152 domain-containing protein [Nitrososphaerota archaeon]